MEIYILWPNISKPQDHFVKEKNLWILRRDASTITNRMILCHILRITLFKPVSKTTAVFVYFAVFFPFVKTAVLCGCCKNIFMLICTHVRYSVQMPYSPRTISQHLGIYVQCCELILILSHLLLVTLDGKWSASRSISNHLVCWEDGTTGNNDLKVEMFDDLILQVKRLEVTLF